MRRPVPHLESVTEKFLKDRVRMLGGYAFKFVPIIAGMPDRIVFMPGGRLFLVETKREGEKPSSIQQVWHQRFAAIGHNVVVLDSRQAVIDWLRDIVEASGPQKGKPGPRPKA